MTGRLTEIVRCQDVEINVGKAKVMRISREPSPLQNMIDQKQLANVEYFNFIGTLITNNARCICEIKSRTAMAKTKLKKKKKDSFHQQIGLKFKVETSKVLHLEHSITRC